MDKDIAEMTAAIEQAFAADPICGGRFCSGTAETAARAAYAVVQARVEELAKADAYLGKSLEVLMPLLFRHKKDFGELQIVIDACGKARAALAVLNPTGDNHAE